MSRLGDFVMGVICGGALTVGSMNFHVVRANDGMHVVRKLTTGVEDTYVDIREFTPADWNTHRVLAAAIVRAGKGELLADSSLSSFRTAIEGWLSGLNNEGKP
jgi:hypothetical protein